MSIDVDEKLQKSNPTLCPSTRSDGQNIVKSYPGRRTQTDAILNRF